MEEKIEVGEYVRTKDGRIDKVEIFSVGCCVWHCENGMCIDECNRIGTHLEEIVKHSKQLIDLIEVGDYVNGKFVIATDNRINDNGEKVILIENYDEWTDDGVISNKDIKSIVTHEQFNSIKYEVI